VKRSQAVFSEFKKGVFAVLLGVLLLAPAVRANAQAAAPSSVPAGSSATPEAQSPEANKHEEDETEAYRHSAAVKKIGSMMGMNADQAATSFEVANFVLLAILVGWVLLKTLPKTFRNRNSAIQKHLVEARVATEEASLRLSGVESRLSKLDEQIAAMKAQAEKDSAADEQRIKASVEEEKQKILAAAEQEIASASTHARRQIQQYAAELAVEQAARKLVVTAETDRLLVQGFARRLGLDDAKGGEN